MTQVFEKRKFDGVYGVRHGKHGPLPCSNAEFRRCAFECFYDRNSGAAYEELAFRECSFVSSAISIADSPALRSTVRNVRLISCEVEGCALECAVVEDVLIDGLRTHGLLQCWGAVFKHVTVRGRIGRIMISPAHASVLTGKGPPGVQKAFDEANAAYYRTVDWALDISEGEFEECDIRRLPAHLIKRDPETQVVVKRYKALDGVWRDLPLSRTYWSGWIDLFLKNGDPDVVLVAPKRNRKFKELLVGLQVLRKAGVAEPD